MAIELPKSEIEPHNLGALSLRDTRSLGDIKISSLASMPDAIPIVATWLSGEWGGDIEDRIARLHVEISSQGLPCTFVATLGNDVVGCASLKADDMDTHSELSPWLARVYVSPNARGQGIGSCLTSFMWEEAIRLGHQEVYLFTPDQERLYARLGWNTISTEQYHGKEVVIMHKDHK